MDMASARDIPELEFRHSIVENLVEKIEGSAFSERKNETMNTEKIAELIELAEKNLEIIELKDFDDNEVSKLQWRIISSLAEAKAIANIAKVRAKGQVLIQRLVIAECDSLIIRCHLSLQKDSVGEEE